MELLKCERCENESLEVLETHVICHSCNLNSADGFPWHMREDRFGVDPVEHDSEDEIDSEEFSD